MAEKKQQVIACPRCGKKIEIEMWDGIEMPYDAEQKEKVMDNTFFKVHCDDCNFTFPIGYKCLYNDMEQKYLIWFTPKLGENEQKEIAAYNEKLKTDHRLKLAQGGYSYRIVRNDNELREKVLIFDEGLDDRYIETMKLVYLPVFKRSIAKESRILAIYFDKKADGEGYQWVLLFDNKKPMVTDIKMEIYEDMKVKLKEIVEEKTGEGLIQIHGGWAVDVMTEHGRQVQDREEKEE